MVDIPEPLHPLLRSNALVHVATIGPDGAPQNNPVWFEWDGAHVLFSTTVRTQKYTNIRREPRVALSICDAAEPYVYLEFRGVVTSIEDDPDNAFINGLSRRYGFGTDFPIVPGYERVIVHVRPDRVGGWMYAPRGA